MASARHPGGLRLTAGYAFKAVGQRHHRGVGCDLNNFSVAVAIVSDAEDGLPADLAAPDRLSSDPVSRLWHLFLGDRCVFGTVDLQTSRAKREEAEKQQSCTIGLRRSLLALTAPWEW